jgi:ribose 5-phosphate isomerase A
MSADDEKRVAAEAAAELVEPGMTLGLGTGTTVAHLLPAIARRRLAGVRCVSTSPATEQLARELGLRTESFDDVTAFDLAIDGADQVAPDWWLVKGGGAAHTREKLVAAAATRFVVIADSSKTAAGITAPIPLELVAFGVPGTLARLRAQLGPTALRDVPRSPDGGVIADYHGDVGDPAALAVRLSGTPGVIEHGLFPPELVSAVIVGRGGDATWLERGDSG